MFYDDECDCESTAELLYEKLGDEPDTDKCHQTCLMQAKKIEEKTIERVIYCIYTFFDGSKLTIGNNGFIGSETPAKE